MKLLNQNVVDQPPPPSQEEKKESFWKKIDSMLNGPLITAFVSLALIMIPPLQVIVLSFSPFNF